MKNVTVKVIEYQLAKGVEERVFLGASATLMPELAKLRGFIKRELHKGENSKWRDVVYWKSRKDADQSEVDIPNLPACVACIAMMDHSEMTVARFELVQQSQNLAEYAEGPLRVPAKE